MRYDKHIFICTNQKAEGKACCGEARGQALVDAFKAEIKLSGIKRVRAQKTGCLDLCTFGPAAIVYPEGIVYGHLTLEDVPMIVREHLVGNQPVASKILPEVA